MLDRCATNRRVVLAGLTLITFLLSILEPIPRTNVLENMYQSLKSPFVGLADEPLDLGSDQKFCRAFYDSRVKMDVDFMVNVTLVTERYANIFQTDNLNSGLRIEISPDGKLNVFVQSPDGGPEKVVNILANGVVKSKALTKVIISVQQNVLTVQINDGPIAPLEGNFRPTCNRVLIGGGYDSNRTTFGGVRAVVRIQDSEIVTRFGLSLETRALARMLFTLLVVGHAWEYRKKLFVFTNREIQQ
jgi:hypothetical protein